MNIGIVGAGIFGLASALELRARGHSVTIFDQGKIPYENASSTDVSKAIRRTWYGDNDSYVDLVERASTQWRTWEKQSKTQIYHQVGHLVITNNFEAGTPLYESVKYLSDRGNDIQILSGNPARTRFPQFVINEDEVCIYDSWGGYIESGRAVSLLAQLACEEGVDVVENSPATQVEDIPHGARIVLSDRGVAFDRVVVACGVWTTRLLPELSEYIRVTHQQMVLIEVDKSGPLGPMSMPVWGVDLDISGWYGFPALREGYAKVSLEPPGDTVDPDLDRRGTQGFTDQTLRFLQERIPEMAKGKFVGSRSCLYSNTPDDHFLIDWVPGYSRVLVAGGGSGHGFKFGGSIGEIIADALEERINPRGTLFKIGNRLSRQTLNNKPPGVRGFAQPKLLHSHLDQISRSCGDL